MKRHGKKLETKRDTGMSFSELVQRIVQRDANGLEQELEKPKPKKATPTSRRRKKTLAT